MSREGKSIRIGRYGLRMLSTQIQTTKALTVWLFVEAR